MSFAMVLLHFHNANKISEISTKQAIAVGIVSLVVSDNPARVWRISDVGDKRENGVEFLGNGSIIFGVLSGERVFDIVIIAGDFDFDGTILQFELSVLSVLLSGSKFALELAVFVFDGSYRIFVASKFFVGVSSGFLSGVFSVGEFNLSGAEFLGIDFLYRGVSSWQFRRAIS